MPHRNRRVPNVDSVPSLALGRIAATPRSSSSLVLASALLALSACDPPRPGPLADGPPTHDAFGDAGAPSLTSPSLTSPSGPPTTERDGGSRAPTAQPPSGTLVGSDILATLSVDEIRAASDPEYRPYLTHDVTIYRIVYAQPYRDESITVSGALLVPSTSRVAALAAFNHYTIFRETRIPSNATLDNPDNFLARGAILAASYGYAVIAPDYVGHGVDLGVHPHSYEISEALAQSVVYGVLAAQEQLAAQAIEGGDQVFLFGFSEGASASVAAHREIEAGAYDSIALGGTVACGGCYQLGRLAETALNDDHNELPAPSAAAYLVVAYDAYYPDLGRGLAHYFDASAVTLIEGGIFDGGRTWSAINALMPDDVGDLFTRGFLAEVRSGTSPLVARLHDNDLVAFAPRAPMHLVAGRRDDICPAFQSEALHTYDQNRGNRVTRLTLLDEDHEGIDSKCTSQALLSIEGWRR